MSTKTRQASKRSSQAGSKRSERYIQPSILLALKDKPSYGYELIQGICQFGFVAGQAPPGMIYRHLRDLEESGLVASKWETRGTGPAKRVYRLTADGDRVLDQWIVHMNHQAQRLLNFVERYENVKKIKG